MARETGRTVAIVATPSALAEVRSTLKRAGVDTQKIEIAEIKLKREVLLPERSPLVFAWRHVALGGIAAFVLALTVCSTLDFTVARAAATSLGAVFAGAVLGAVVSVLTSKRVETLLPEGPATLSRSYWKLRVDADAMAIARAKGIASRTGRTLQALVSGAFEVRKG